MAEATIGAAIEVHRHMGAGLPEVSYKRALSHELSLRGIPHDCEVRVPLVYKGIPVGEEFIDILVGGRLVVELKVVEHLTEVHRAQVIAYLSATGVQLALLINFNVALLRDGIKRVIQTS
ncbi:MAG: GxxExxY protein [Tepidisphaeraceae bacterium]